MNATSPQWTPACSVDALPPGKSRVFKKDGQQVALFHLEGGDLYAVDNRCPHEGYPLAQGNVKDCLLTCAWHNFKFDLRDGACVMGDEAVHTYAVRVKGGHIEVDLTPPDPAEAIPRLKASLEEGLQKYSLGRVSRDVARLLQAGVEASDLAAEAAVYDARYVEYGSSHALPVATDILRYLPRYPGLKATLPLMQAFDVAARGSIRMPERPLPDAIDPGEDPIAAGVRLRSLVEDEEADEAQALLRGALAKGWGRAEIEPWFYRITADHFLDFGHRLIYTVKVMDLLDATGWHRADPILVTFLFGIVNGTREDTLPKWAGWQRRRMALRPSLTALYEAKGHRPFEAAERAAFIDALVDGKGPAAFEAVLHSVEAGASLTAIADALVMAASHRLLRFNVDHDLDPTLQNSWLDITHILTFADALTHAVRRWHDPGIIELLLQGAHFTNHAKALDLPEARRFDLETAAPAQGDLSTALMEAIDRRQTQRALSLAIGWHRSKGDVALLRTQLEDRAIGHPAVRPIFVAHHIKTTIAAFDRYEALSGDELQPLPLLAAVAFLASDARERPIERLVHEAIDFVENGRTPRTLT